MLVFRRFMSSTPGHEPASKDWYRHISIYASQSCLLHQENWAVLEWCCCRLRARKLLVPIVLGLQPGALKTLNRLGTSLLEIAHWLVIELRPAQFSLALRARVQLRISDRATIRLTGQTQQFLRTRFFVVCPPQLMFINKTMHDRYHRHNKAMR